MTLAVVALFARGPTTLTGIASWRVKETDRIAAMATELAQAGRDGRCGRRSDDRRRRRDARARDDRHLRRPPDGDVLFARGARRRPVRILDPECVRKTFPGYFAAFDGVALR